MSRLHKLFHRPSGSEAKFPAPDLALSPSATASLASATGNLVATEFPIEEARFGPEDRLIFHTDPHCPAADRFRLLRMRLKEPWKAGKLKKLLVTGPIACEGKSTVTLNLAAALAERGKHTVLLVDADLHGSSLTERLHLKPWSGLTDCLMDESHSPFSCIRRIEPLGWYFLPAGEPRKNATELLQTRTFGHIMQEVSACFDWILIDSPPVVPITDSISMQQHVDATLLVVRAGKTPREAVERTIELLGQKNILGIVLNGVEVRNHLHFQYYEYSRSYPED